MTEPKKQYKHVFLDDTHPLVKAIYIDNNYNKLKQLLEEGANVNESLGNLTPLLLAVLALPETPIYLESFNIGVNLRFIDPSLDIIKLLIDNGADVNRGVRNLGVTPLMMAASAKQNYKLVKLLIERGADVNAVDIAGNTALMIAATGIHADGHIYASPYLIDVVKTLIDSGANVNLINNDGKTALDLCGKGTFYGARAGFDSIAKAIRDAGGESSATLSKRGGRSISRRHSSKKIRLSSKNRRKTQRKTKG